MKPETSLQRILSRTAKIIPQFSLPRYLLEGGIVLLLMIATVVINWKMIKDGLNGNVDLKWHLTWIQHFAKQLSEGIGYPRWLAGTNYGYGSPTFVFYPPLVYYLGSFLQLSGLNTQDVVICLFSLALFLSGFTFYWYGRNKWGTLAALVGALAYMTTPYLAFDIYWRNGLASIFVQALIPLLWWLTERSLSHAKWRIGLGLCWTTIALTHTPSLLLCAAVWLPYTLFFLLNTSWKAVMGTIFSAGMGLGVASFYLLPAILEKRFVNIEIMKGVYGGIPGSLLGSGIPLFSDNHISDIFLHQSFVLIVLMIIAFVCCRRQSPVLQETRHWLMLAFPLVFMMSAWSEFIWQASPTLQMVQFAWRLLQIVSFVGASLCATVVSGILQLRLGYRFVLSLIIVGILLMNFRYSYQLSRKYITLRNPGRGNIEHLEHIITILNDPYTDKLRDVEEYRPLIQGSSSPPVPLIGQPKLSVLNGQATFQIQKWGSYQRMFSVTAETLATIRIRTYSYPAWHLYVNGKSHPLSMAGDGTLAFQLEPGSYQIELRYQWTIALMLGVMLSSLSFVALLYLNWQRRT